MIIPYTFYKKSSAMVGDFFLKNFIVIYCLKQLTLEIFLATMPMEVYLN